MPSSPTGMLDAVKRNLQKNTGKTIEAWLEIVRGQGLTTAKEASEWLRRTHGLGRDNSPGVIAWEAFGAPDYVVDSPEALLGAQYAGPKAGSAADL